jgi:PAS domain S-box-containing protein
MNFPFLKFPIRDFDKIKSLQQLREQLLNLLLLITFFMGSILYVIALLPVLDKSLPTIPLIYTLLYIWLALVTFLRRAPYTVRTGSWLIIFYLLGTINLTLSGFNTDAGMCFLTFVSMAALLFDLRRGLIALGISTATIILACYFIVSRGVDLHLGLPQSDPLLWIIGGMIFVVTGFFLILSLTVLVRGLLANLTKSTSEAEKLEQANQALRASEERYRTLVEISPDLVTLIGLDGKIIMINQPGLDLFDYELADVIGYRFLTIIAPDDHPFLAEVFQKTLDSGLVRDVVCQCIRGDGTLFYAEFSASLIVDGKGRPQAVMSVGRDITVRKRVELALQESRDELENNVRERTADLIRASERLRELVARSPAVIFSTAVTNNFPVLFISENVRELTGYGSEQFTADPGFWFGHIHPDDRQLFPADILQTIKNDESVQQYRFLHRDGRYIWMRDVVRLIRSPQGEPLELVGSWVNITAQKQAEESYKTLLENSMQGIIVFQDDHIVYVNRAIEENFGFTLDELKFLAPEKINEYVHPDDQVMIWGRMQARLAGQVLSDRYEIRMFHKNGEIRYVDVDTVSIQYGGKPAMQTTVIDLTERRKIEQALRESEETGRVILNTTTASLALMDSNGTVLAANNITAKRLGKELNEILGKSVYQFFPEEIARSRKMQIDKVFRIGEMLHYEDFRDGIWFENYIYPILDTDGQVKRVVISARDVTERKQMEQSLSDAKNELEGRVAERTRELTESREQLRKLTKDVVLAQEEERRRVSRELHDEAGQALVSMKYGLESILSELPKAHLPIRDRLTSAIQQLDQTMEQIRHLAHSLRPPLFDIADLDLTLKDYCREFADSTGLQIEYSGVSIPDLSEEAGLSFFRFLQEALTNVVKHANATRVTVKLSRQAGKLSLSATDNGVGPSDLRADGRGHIGMRERFIMLNGEVQIEAGQRSGFVITASIPCDAKDIEAESAT